MKKKTLTAIAIAAILIVAGVALCAVSVGMGAQPKTLFTDGTFTINLDHDIHHGFSGSKSDGKISTWPGEDGAEELHNSIDEVVVDWVSGSVRIESFDEAYVRFFERADGHKLAEDKALRYTLDGSTLHIEYRESDSIIGFSFGDSFAAKDLVIYVPESVRNIRIDSVSADVDISSLVLSRGLSVGTTSGEVSVTNTEASSIHFESTSGDVYFEGRCSDFEADSTSGIVEAVFASLPSELEVDTVSGDAQLSFPADTNFELEFETVSGRLESDFRFSVHDGDYVAGRGGAEVNVSTVSGNCTIKEN